MIATLVGPVKSQISLHVKAMVTLGKNYNMMIASSIIEYMMAYKLHILDNVYVTTYESLVIVVEIVRL